MIPSFPSVPLLPHQPPRRVLSFRRRVSGMTAPIASPQSIVQAAATASGRVNASVAPFAEDMRPMSTLKPQRKFQPAQLKNGTLYFYTNQVRVTSRRTAHVPFLLMMAALAMPDLEQRQLDTITLKGFYKPKTFFPNLMKSFTDGNLMRAVRVVPAPDGFEVELPMFPVPATFLQSDADQSQSPIAWLARNRRFVADGSAGGTTDPDFPSGGIFSHLTQRHYTSQEIVAACSKVGSPALNVARVLATAPDSGITFRRVGAYTVAFLRVFFTKDQASVICQTEPLMLRPVDFYNMMLGWSRSRLGTYRRHALYCTPLSDIAMSIPPGGVPRVSDDLSIMIDQDSRLFYLPQECNRVSSFEGESIRELQRPDGSYSFIPLDDSDQPAPRPKSGLVLLDWVNLKMTYINNEGNPVVLPLDRCRPATNSHYIRFLNKIPVVSDYGKNFVSMVMGAAASVANTQNHYSAELLAKEVLTGSPDAQGWSLTDVCFRDLWMNDQLPFCRLFREDGEALLNYAAMSIENLYEKYAFENVSQVLAGLRIMKDITPKYSHVAAQVREERAPYENQVVDPNYEIPALPYFRDDVGFQPHQFRTMSRLRGSPKFAILAVDAGGGKTLLGIADYLKEVALGSVKRGLFLCPRHLVANYVREFLYFTKGKVNVLALNTETMRTHGIEGLQKMVETAPPNTVVVTDYDLVMGASKAFVTGYGPVSTKSYPFVDTLRCFKFDYVFCDESHTLKNMRSSMSQGVARLINEIPFKRLASGTLTPNRIEDLVAQINLMDPTIFHTASFETEYKRKVGNRFVWDNAAIMADLQEQVEFVMVKRKEWAAWLPSLVESKHLCRLTKAQQEVYGEILVQAVQKILEAAKADKKLAVALGMQAADDLDDEDENPDGDPDGAAAVDSTEMDITDIPDLDAMLRPHLTTLEAFVAAPGANQIAAVSLSAEDHVSPKLHKMVEIIENHISSGTPGKILVFCNYNAEAEAYYEALPPHLKSRAIAYTAAEKTQCVAEFETNPEKMIMIGVEVSMNTGLNLQFASRLIRMSSVWTPGALEQGNARILRPNIKTAETRTKVYIDWVVCEYTIDVVKQAFLFNKKIKVQLFEESGNPLYKNIEPPVDIRMTLDTIRDSALASNEMVEDIDAVYQQVREAEFIDFESYRRRNQQDAIRDPETGQLRPKMTPIKSGPHDPDAKLMYRIPYVAGTELYNANELGLVRYDQYLKLETADLEVEDDHDDEDSDATRQEYMKVNGAAVHTEFGEGVITGVHKRTVSVLLNNGQRVAVRKLAAFIITRTQTNNLDMREELLKEIGEIPYDAPPKREHVPTGRAVIRVAKPDGSGESTATVLRDFTLRIQILNDYPVLQFGAVKTRPRVTQYLEAKGFSQPEPFYYTDVPTPEHLLRLFTAWKNKGYHVDPNFSDPCRQVYTNFKTMRNAGLDLIGLGTQSKLQNFFRMVRKPVADRSTLCPYPVVEEDGLMVVLPITGHPASARGITVPVPGIKWKLAPVENLRQKFFPNLPALDAAIREMLNEGVQIRNIDELREQRAQYRTKAHKKFLFDDKRK